MYGGRDAKAYVPVQQSFSWEHGIIAYGASLETETTFATIGKEGVPEINMMSIQDFISIPMGKNVNNNLEFGRKLKKQPIVFGVNYFLREVANGKYLNSPHDKHVWVKWMELRVHNEADAIKTPTGYIPKYDRPQETLQVSAQQRLQQRRLHKTIHHPRTRKPIKNRTCLTFLPRKRQRYTSGNVRYALHATPKTAGCTSKIRRLHLSRML
jgi:GTP-dependent phosphoenolpyruvate carboxykinase